MATLRSQAGGVLIVGVRHGVGQLLAHWADSHGRPAARAESVAVALDMLRRLPFVAVVCGGDVLSTHDTFADRLHRRQPRTALIVLDADADSAALPTALDHGAVDRLVPPCDRTRFGVALARAAEWAANSEACRRRAIVVRVNGRIRALDRVLARQIASWAAVRHSRLRCLPGIAPGLAKLRAMGAKAGMFRQWRPSCPGEDGSLGALSWALSAVVTAKSGRTAASEPDWTEYHHALAMARVAQVVARLCGPTTDPLETKHLQGLRRLPHESTLVVGDPGADAAA